MFCDNVWTKLLTEGKKKKGVMFKGIGHFSINQKQANKTRTDFVARSFILLFLK